MRNVQFSNEAMEDLVYWSGQDRKTLKRIFKLIRECQKTPFEGTGKPEPLKYALTGNWSRRIDSANRMVYSADDNTVYVSQLRYHY